MRLNTLYAKNYILIVPAVSKPITLEEIKSYLRITGSTEDSLLNIFIDSAVSAFEACSNIDLMNKTYKAYLDSFPFDDFFCFSQLNTCYNYPILTLPRGKVSSIVQIQYYKDGNLVTFDSSKYRLLESTSFGKLTTTENNSYPTNADCIRQAVEITFVSGFGDTAADIPSDIKIALMSYIANLYENRGDCNGCGISNPPQFSKACMRYKIREW